MFCQWTTPRIKRLLTDSRVSSTLVENLPFKCHQARSDDDSVVEKQMLFIDRELLTILKNTNPLPSHIPTQIVEHLPTNFPLVEWALDHKDFPLALKSMGLIDSHYFPIKDEIHFYNIVQIVLPRVKGGIRQPRVTSGLVNYACKIGSIKWAKVLMEGYKFEVNNLECLWNACDSRNSELVLYLVDVLPDSTQSLDSLFMNACRSGNMDTISFLLSFTQIDKELSIVCASIFHRVKSVQFLLKEGVDLSARNYQVLVQAMATCHIPTIELLLDHLMMESISDIINLMRLVSQDNVDLVRFIMKHPKTRDLFTTREIFDKAVEFDKHRIIKSLLADVWIDYSLIESTIDRVIRFKDDNRILRILLDNYKGPIVNSTPLLILAINCNNLDTLILLGEDGRFNLEDLFLAKHQELMLEFFCNKYDDVMEYILSKTTSLGQYPEFIKRVYLCLYLTNFISNLIIRHPFVDFQPIAQHCFYNVLKSQNNGLVESFLSTGYIDPLANDFLAIRLSWGIYESTVAMLDYVCESSCDQSPEKRTINLLKGTRFSNEKYPFLFRVANKNLNLVKDVLDQSLQENISLCDGCDCLFQRKSSLFNNSEKLLDLLLPFCKCGYIDNKVAIF